MSLAPDAPDRPRQFWIVGANLVPVAGVLFFGWSALPLMVYYWIENVAVGAFNVPKILISGLTKEWPFKVAALIFAPFFIAHFGLFCFVHGIFVFAIFAMSDAVSGADVPNADAFDLAGNVWALLQTDNDLSFAVIVMIAVQFVSFLILWLLRGEWREANPMTLMFEPYGRVIVLHLTIMLAAIPVILLGQPMLAVLILALLKAGVELGLPYFKFAASPDPETTKRAAAIWLKQMKRAGRDD